MTGLPDGRKSAKIDLAVLIRYRRVRDSQPPKPATLPSQVRALCISASVSKNHSVCRALYVVCVCVEHETAQTLFVAAAYTTLTVRVHV